MTTKHRRRMAMALAGLLLAVGGVVVAFAAGADHPDPPFTWSMQERFGGDADRDRRIDERSDPAYLAPASWRVSLGVCPEDGDPGDTASYQWAVTDHGGATLQPLAETTCEVQHDFAVLGAHSVRVRGLDSTGAQTFTHTETITLRDHLIVSVGDSIASGEGSPDLLLPPGTTGSFGPAWQDRRCHRTALAGPAQAAIRLERRDPHSSVTFVHLACSGATIPSGLLGEYEGIEDTKVLPKVPAQLPTAKQLATTAGRQIDALLVSIGANDANFSGVVKTCLEFERCQSFDIPGTPNAQQQFDALIGNVPAGYATLDTYLRTQMAAVLRPGAVHLTEYFDPAKRTATEYCDVDDSGTDAGGVLESLSAEEYEWASKTVVGGINAEVVKATSSYGWTFVGGVADRFAEHGYCASDRWTRTVAESLLYQDLDPSGAFHPNSEGQRYAYAPLIDRAVATHLGITAPALSEDPPDPDVMAILDGSQSLMDELDLTQQLLATGVFADGNGLANTGIGKVRDLLASIQQGLETAMQPTSRANRSLTKLDAFLDDPDQDGNPDSDAFGAPFAVDVQGSLGPRTPTRYDLKALALDLPAQEYDVRLSITRAVRWPRPARSPARKAR